jgi:hypothetical protein
LKAIRFRPPVIDPTPELRWILHRAFARSGTPVPPPLDPAGALDLARRFSLAGRIGARTPSGTLKTEIGSSADQITLAVESNAASSLLYAATLRHVAGHAASMAIPLVVLKGCAICLLGITPPGARSFGDLDVLVPADRIPELLSALLAAGWTLSSVDGGEHQESALTHPSLGVVELHRFIPGVRLPGSLRSFNARTLLGASLTEAIPGFHDAVRAPARVLLVAHAIVHALDQHSYAPWTYPLFRFLGDLQDLGSVPESLHDAGRFLRDVDSADLAAVGLLVAALESGTALELPAGPARSLLHHLVAGELDPAYALVLKEHNRFLWNPSNLPRPLAALRWAYEITVLSRAQVDAIYGPPKRWGGYAARQLLRPFDLALRLRRSVRARK